VVLRLPWQRPLPINRPSEDVEISPLNGQYAIEWRSHLQMTFERIDMPAKRVIIDGVVLQALTILGSDLGKDFQELTEEAFSDLLKKHRRPVGLKAALQESLRQMPANDGHHRPKK
jgi:hypothetical protein